MNTNHETPKAPAAASPVDTLERWELDPARSVLDFSIRHLVIQEIRGRFRRWGGAVLVDRADPSRSRVDLWIDLASIETGSEERDAHVRSPEFLDVAQFPRARFVSASVEADEERIRVRGTLHLHGTIGDVVVEVIPDAVTRDPQGVLRSAYTARATVNRQAFGLHWNQDLDVGGVVVGDRVELRAKVEMVQVERNKCA
jgi:polyisoprenoid-binding protein YceI